MRNLFYAARPIVTDMFSTILFAALFALTNNVYLSTGAHTRRITGHSRKSGAPFTLRGRRPSPPRRPGLYLGGSDSSDLWR